MNEEEKAALADYVKCLTDCIVRQANGKDVPWRDLQDFSDILVQKLEADL